VKKGFSWSDQIGIAIAALVDGGRRNLVTWTQEASVIILSLFCPFIRSLCILPFIRSLALSVTPHSISSATDSNYCFRS
jgi:hypothetical protein